MKSKVCVITSTGKRVCGRPTTRASGSVARGKDAKIERIAKSILGFRLSVPQGGDRIRRVSIWSVRQGLDAAYIVGYLAARGHADPALRMSDEAATEIARRDLGFPTLESRYSDSLNFRNVDVDRVRTALSAAFDAGKRAGKR